MSAVRKFVVLSLIAAAVGAMTAAVAATLRDPAMVEPDPIDRHVDVDSDTDLQPERDADDDALRDEAASGDARGDGTPVSSTAPLQKRFSAADPETRHAAALELLRRGPSALVQARALRPSRPEGRNLSQSVAYALQKLEQLARHADYDALPQFLKDKQRLDTFAAVVPEELLVDERLAYWSGAEASVRERLERDLADTGELAFAVLQHARARRDAGTMSADDYGALLEEQLAAARAWVAGLSQDRKVPPARVSKLEARLALLSE